MNKILLKICIKAFIGLIVVHGISNISFIEVKEKKAVLIEWHEDYKLSWDDFQGVPDTTVGYKAIVITKIKAIPESYSNDSIVYRISNFFNKEESWAKMDSVSQSLLAHEQFHFNISELIARKTRKAYSSIDLKGLKGDYTRISNLFNYYTIYVADSLQKKYDTETNHGIDFEEQKLWESYVKLELSNYKAYSSPVVTIK